MNKGFTLLELLVVVLIIGILASIALPQYTKAVEKARATEAMQILGDLATAEQIYQMGFGEYTDNLDLLDIEMPGSRDGDSTTITKNFRVTITQDGSTFQAAASRANSDGVAISSPNEPEYAIMINIDASGTITRWCGTNSSTAYGEGTNKHCKSIANNSTGIIK